VNTVFAICWSNFFDVEIFSVFQPIKSNVLRTLPFFGNLICKVLQQILSINMVAIASKVGQGSAILGS
jgi:hypothetical protein